MKRIHKGASANIGGVRKLLVSMKWTSGADFDLAAVYEGRNGEQGMVLPGDRGNAGVFPHIYCPDDGSEGINGNCNEEKFLIHRCDLLKYVWIMCWDYEKIQKGLPAEFKESNILLTVTDDRGNIVDIQLDNDAGANTALIAAIDSSRPVTAKIINSSRTEMFKGLKNLYQIMDILQQDQKAKTSGRIILE